LSATRGPRNAHGLLTFDPRRIGIMLGQQRTDLFEQLAVTRRLHVQERFLLTRR
jgi:hypothetical protein